MGVAGLAAALRAGGHEVVDVRPSEASASLLRRILFNLRLPFAFDPGSVDLVVTFDLDGCYLPADGVPRVACLKGIAADELRFERGATRLRMALQARLERRSVLRADRVLVTSEYCREVAERAYGVPRERLSIVPEGIDPSAWRPPRGPAGACGALTVLSVGRQYPRKNTETLLRALARVRERVPEVELRVVGGGPRLPALRELATSLDLDDSVSFLGEVEDRDDLRAEYAAADLFCLPSRQEGFGIVFLEAMASGLPVVAGDAAAVPEVVPDGEAGILVPPDDEGALADALVRLLADPRRREEMGERGRERAAAFAWERVAERFLAASGGLRNLVRG